MLGCYHCQNTFPPWAVVDCTIEPDGRQTLLCPFCGIDAVTSTTDPLGLATMHQQGFVDPAPLPGETK